MKPLLFLLSIFIFFLQGIGAGDSEFEAVIKANDPVRALAVFKSKDLADEDLERANEFFAATKEKHRKNFTYAIRDKGLTGVIAGKHIHSELLRLIKENLVEDDLDYTLACLNAALINKNTDLIYAVAPFLVHPQSRLRIEANKIVAAKKDERIYPLLGQLLSGDAAIDKVYAMETLLALKDERAVPMLMQQLGHANKNVRYFALKTLDAIGSDKAQYGIIHLAEEESDEEVRLKAVEILRHFKTGPVTFALQKLIADKILAVRSLALESALFQKNKSYANAISDQLAQESELKQKYALLRGLLALGSGGGMNGVLALLKRDQEEDLLIWSAYACHYFNESRCADLLVGYLQKESGELMRIECITALGVFRQKKHVQTLLGVLESDKNTNLTRSAAIAALREYDSDAVIHPLFELYAREKEQTVRVQMKVLLSDLMRKKLPKL